MTLKGPDKDFWYNDTSFWYNDTCFWYNDVWYIDTFWYNDARPNGGEAGDITVNQTGKRQLWWEENQTGFLIESRTPLILTILRNLVPDLDSINDNVFMQR